MDFLRTIQEGTPLFLTGLKLTVSISVLAILIGMVIGFITCLFRISNSIILKAISGIYVDF